MEEDVENPEQKMNEKYSKQCRPAAEEKSPAAERDRPPVEEKSPAAEGKRTSERRGLLGKWIEEESAGRSGSARGDVSFGRPTPRVVLRYILLQVPGVLGVSLALLALRLWLELSWWWVGGGLLVWVIKDAVLFPFVWPSYAEQGGSAEDRYSLVGQQGVVAVRLEPGGMVRLRGERWQARLVEENTSLEVGAPMEVVQVEGLTLLVRPLEH